MSQFIQLLGSDVPDSYGGCCYYGALFSELFTLAPHNSGTPRAESVVTTVGGAMQHDDCPPTRSHTTAAPFGLPSYEKEEEGYLFFNCPEGAQRFSSEANLRLTRVKCFCFTRFGAHTETSTPDAAVPFSSLTSTRAEVTHSRVSGSPHHPHQGSTSHGAPNGSARGHLNSAGDLTPSLSSKGSCSAWMGLPGLLFTINDGGVREVCVSGPSRRSLWCSPTSPMSHYAASHETEHAMSLSSPSFVRELFPETLHRSTPVCRAATGESSTTCTSAKTRAHCGCEGVEFFMAALQRHYFRYRAMRMFLLEPPPALTIGAPHEDTLDAEHLPRSHRHEDCDGTRCHVAPPRAMVSPLPWIDASSPSFLHSWMDLRVLPLSRTTVLIRFRVHGSPLGECLSSSLPASRSSAPPTSAGEEVFSYVLVEAPPSAFDMGLAKELGIRPGPKYGLLKRGIPVQRDDEVPHSSARDHSLPPTEKGSKTGRAARRAAAAAVRRPFPCSTEVKDDPHRCGHGTALPCDPTAAAGCKRLRSGGGVSTTAVKECRGEADGLPFQKPSASGSPHPHTELLDRLQSGEPDGRCGCPSATTRSSDAVAAASPQRETTEVEEGIEAPVVCPPPRRADPMIYPHQVLRCTLNSTRLYLTLILDSNAAEELQIALQHLLLPPPVRKGSEGVESIAPHPTLNDPPSQEQETPPVMGEGSLLERTLEHWAPSLLYVAEGVSSAEQKAEGDQRQKGPLAAPPPHHHLRERQDEELHREDSLKHCSTSTTTSPTPLRREWILRQAVHLQPASYFTAFERCRRSRAAQSQEIHSERSSSRREWDAEIQSETRRTASADVEEKDEAGRLYQSYLAYLMEPLKGHVTVESGNEGATTTRKDPNSAAASPKTSSVEKERLPTAAEDNNSDELELPLVAGLDKEKSPRHEKQTSVEPHGGQRGEKRRREDCTMREETGPLANIVTPSVKDDIIIRRRSPRPEPLSAGSRLRPSWHQPVLHFESSDCFEAPLLPSSSAWETGIKVKMDDESERASAAPVGGVTRHLFTSYIYAQYTAFPTALAHRYHLHRLSATLFPGVDESETEEGDHDGEDVMGGERPTSASPSSSSSSLNRREKGRRKGFWPYSFKFRTSPEEPRRPTSPPPTASKKDSRLGSPLLSLLAEDATRLIEYPSRASSNAMLSDRLLAAVAASAATPPPLITRDQESPSLAGSRSPSVTETGVDNEGPTQQSDQEARSKKPWSHPPPRASDPSPTAPTPAQGSGALVFMGTGSAVPSKYRNVSGAFTEVLLPTACFPTTGEGEVPCRGTSSSPMNTTRPLDETAFEKAFGKEMFTRSLSPLRRVVVVLDWGEGSCGQLRHSVSSKGLPRSSAAPVCAISREELQRAMALRTASEVVQDETREAWTHRVLRGLCGGTTSSLAATPTAVPLLCLATDGLFFEWRRHHCLSEREATAERWYLYRTPLGAYLQDLDVVFLSHAHADHHLGVVSLLELRHQFCCEAERWASIFQAVIEICFEPTASSTATTTTSASMHVPPDVVTNAATGLFCPHFLSAAGTSSICRRKPLTVVCPVEVFEWLCDTWFYIEPYASYIWKECVLDVMAATPFHHRSRRNEQEGPPHQPPKAETMDAQKVEPVRSHTPEAAKDDAERGRRPASPAHRHPLESCASQRNTASSLEESEAEDCVVKPLPHLEALLEEWNRAMDRYLSDRPQHGANAGPSQSNFPSPPMKDTAEERPDTTAATTPQRWWSAESFTVIHPANAHALLLRFPLLLSDGEKARRQCLHHTKAKERATHVESKVLLFSGDTRPSRSLVHRTRSFLQDASAPVGAHRLPLDPRALPPGVATSVSVSWNDSTRSWASGARQRVLHETPPFALCGGPTTPPPMAHLFVCLHEATFGPGFEWEAVRKCHSTLAEALQVGITALQSHFVVLNHFSQRYPKIPDIASVTMATTATTSFRVPRPTRHHGLPTTTNSSDGKRETPVVKLISSTSRAAEVRETEASSPPVSQGNGEGQYPTDQPGGLDHVKENSPHHHSQTSAPSAEGAEGESAATVSAPLAGRLSFAFDCMRLAFDELGPGGAMDRFLPLSIQLLDEYSSWEQGTTARLRAKAVAER